jgi:hypothetical protein
MKEFYAEIGDFLADYENGTITISENTDFSMRHTVRQITHYIMSNERNPDGRSDIRALLICWSGPRIARSP